MLRQHGRQIYLALMALDGTTAVVLFAALSVRMLRGPGANTQLGFFTLIGLAVQQNKANLVARGCFVHRVR